MKTISPLLARVALLAGLALAGSAWAQNYIVNEFDTAGEVTMWARWWGVDAQTYEFAPTADADEDPNSGALKVTVTFDYATHAGNNQFSALRNLPTPINGLDYTNLSMDVYFPANSIVNSSGNVGWFEYGIRHTDWTQDYFGGVTLRPTNGWVHLEAAIPLTHETITNIAGVTFKMWAGNAGSALNGTLTFYVDNIRFGRAEGPIAPPTLSIEPAQSGLLCTTTMQNNQWQRQGVRALGTAVGTNFSWVPHSFDAVSYSLNIKSFPGVAYPDFQAHLFLIPEVELPWGPNDTSIDWNAPNAVFFHFNRNPDGSGSGYFMYKTNQPNGNSMFWNTNPTNGGVGYLAYLWSPKPEGTWSVTFNNEQSSITLTEPTGSTTNFSMPAEAVALFNTQVFAYVGAQPNSSNNIGQSVIFGSINFHSEAPAFPSFEDPFTASSLDPALWTVVAADPSGVVAVPAEAQYWVNWTLPDIGFTLQSTTNLVSTPWADLTPAIAPIVGEIKKGLITTPLLPVPNGFFRMFKP